MIPVNEVDFFEDIVFIHIKFSKTKARLLLWIYTRKFVVS